MGGNMTQVEKKLNREDLNAWKEKDDKQYSMIPGINNQRRYQAINTSPGKTRNDNTLTLDDQQSRMINHIGYNKGIPGSSSAAMSRSIDPNSFNNNNPQN